MNRIKSRQKHSQNINLLVLAIATLGATGALAQTAITPGAVMDSVRPELRGLPKPQLGKPETLPAEAPAPQLDPNAPRFTVTAFRIVGNKTIDSTALQALVADQVGKANNLFDLQKVTAAITEYYRKLGFPVARAVIPAQKVEAGVVQIEIIEGRFDRIQFKGNQRYFDAFLQPWTQPLIGQTVQIAPLEERMLTLGDLPGLSVRAVLQPGTDYGTTSVLTDVQEVAIDGQVSVNNHGRAEVGERRVDASVNFNNILHLGDQLRLLGTQSENELLKMGGFIYSLPVGIWGDRIAFSYTHVDYSIGGALADRGVNIVGRSELGSVSYTHPFLRSLKENRFGTLSVRSFHGTQGGGVSSNNDVLVPEAGLAWNKIYDNFDVAAGGLRMSSNGRRSSGGTNSKAHELKVDGEFSRLFRITNTWDARLAASGQWAPDALADSEKFSAGGPTSVRGYAPADVRGDSGGVFNAEARYHFQAGSMPAQLSLFADSGYVTSHYPATGTPAYQVISSYGVGLTFQPAKALTAELIAAAPASTLSPSDKHKTARLWFNLTAAF